MIYILQNSTRRKSSGAFIIYEEHYLCIYDINVSFSKAREIRLEKNSVLPPATRMFKPV